MLSLYCTALGFITKNEEYNSEENIPNGSIWKTWYYKKLLSNGKWRKCGGYSLLFSMCADDNEQHFN